MYEPKNSDWPSVDQGKDSSQRAKPLRVLLAEDTPINAEMMRAMATHLAIEMDIAANGLEAIEMIEWAIAERKHYSLLLIDVMMPILDGIETTKRLRDRGIGERELPIIAVTAATSMDEVRSYRAAGMQAFLAKPVSIDDLRSTLQAWGHRTRRRKQPTQPALLQELHRQFEARNEDTLQRIEKALASDLIHEEAVVDIQNLLHQIAGTAATFGHPELSDSARDSEHALVAAAYEQNAVRETLESAANSIKNRKIP